MKSKLDITFERQADLFSTFDGESVVTPVGRAGSSRRLPHGTPSRASGPSLADMADILDRSDDYRVLRRLKPRSLVPFVRLAAVETKTGVILDTETTGLDHAKHEVIELGMIAFTYTDGVIGDIVGGVLRAARAHGRNQRGDHQDHGHHDGDGGGTEHQR